MNADPEFGGSWTLEKLRMMEKYLDSFTTVLKKQSFNLIYIDAFAGTGKLKVRHGDATEYAEGSVERALKITDKPFDELFFIEKDRSRYLTLEQRLRNRSECRVIQSDFNEFIDKLEMDWENTRGVLFLDPFGATVSLSTMERIAGFQALDTWILHPTSAIHRMLPRDQPPDNLPGWPDKLDRIFGGNDWRGLYGKDPQQKLFGEPDTVRKNYKAISDLYKGKLRGLFGERFLEETYLLKQNNRVLFEFMFCVGNTRGIKLAKRIARHILTKPYN